MAQAQYDKFVALRKSGIDQQTARKQAYGDIPVAPPPVTTVAPTPTAPTPPGTRAEAIGKVVNQVGGDVKSRQEARQLAELGLSAEEINNVRSRPNWGTPENTSQIPQNRGQTMQGVNGEAFQVAPTNAQGLSTPAQTPAPVQPTEQDINKQYGGFIQDNGINSVQPLNAPTQLPAGTNEPIKTKTEAPVIDAAQTEREKILAKNKATLEQNKQKFELAREDNAIKTTEANNALAGDQNAILNVLRSGGSIPESVKTSPYYKSAEYTYKQIQNFKTMSQGQIATALSNGALVPGTSTYNELIKDPAMEARIKEARIYATPVDSNKVLENQSSQILSQNSKVAQFLDDGLISLDEYNQMTNNSDVVAQAKYKQEKEQALNTFNKEWSDARDKAKKEFAGSAFLDSILSDIDSGYKTRADYLKGEVDIATGTLAELKGTATALFNANINEYIAYRNGQIEVDKTKATNALDIIKNQAEFDQKIAQQAQAMNDPVQAINSVIDQYAKEGIFAQKSAQQHIADAKALIAKGGTLGQYISQMQKDFQAKPEYKAKFVPKADTTPYQIANLGDGKAIMYNQSTGAYNVIGGSGQPVTTQQIPSIVEECRTTGSCGQGVNDYLQKLGDTRVFGNSYSEKQSKINSQEPVVGGIAVWQPTGKMAQPEYGHVGIVSAVNGDQVTITDWNWNGDNKQSTHTVPLSSIQANGGGFYVPKTQPTSQYTDQNINDLAYLTELQEKNPTQAAKDMKELGYTARDLANYKAGNVPLTDKQKTASTDIMSAIGDLVSGDRYDWNDAVGKFDPSRIIGTQDAVDAEVAINNLIAKLTLPNLGVLKGPMSDKDIQFIKEASSKLATKQSNASFERNLIDAYNLAARRAGKPEIQNLSDISQGAQQQTVGGEADYSKYE